MTKLLQKSAILTITLFAALQPTATHTMYEKPTPSTFSAALNTVTSLFHRRTNSADKTKPPSNEKLMFKALKDEKKDGKLELLNTMLKNFPTLVSAKEPGTENTGLHIATLMGDAKIMWLFIKRGAYVNAVNKKMVDNGKLIDDAAPLHIAIKKNNLEAVKLLVQNNANIEMRDGSGLPDPKLNTGFTPLQLTIDNGYTDIFKFLVESGAKITVKEMMDGNTAFLFAAQMGQFDIIKFLLEEKKEIKIDEKNDAGMTALLYAAMTGNIELLKLLLSKGANISETNKDGWNAIHCAARAGQIEVINFLITKGLTLKARTNDGATALQIAVAHALDSSMVKFLIDKGVDINESDNNGNTALHIASKNDNVELVELLVKNGVNVSQADKKNSTAINFAFASTGLACINYFALARGMVLTMLDRISFFEFTKFLLTNKQQNIAPVQNLLQIDSDKLLKLKLVEFETEKEKVDSAKKIDLGKKRFIKSFTEWHESKIKPVTVATNTNSNVVITTTNGLTSTNLNGNKK